MKIHIQEPDGPYCADIDTGVMQVTLKDVFLGVCFETEDGERLSVSMRDLGFEVHYWTDFGEHGFDAGWVRFKNGFIERDVESKTMIEVDEMPTLSASVEELRRLEAWKKATEIVDKIADQHPLETYKGPSLFGATAETITAAEQRVNLTLDISQWLLGEDK